MSEEDIFEQTQSVHLCLIHPVRLNDTYRREVAPVVAVAPSVSDDRVTAMIIGASWRDRLLGLCMAMTKRRAAFGEAVVQSLRDPRGIAIVPACAVLGVLARRGIFPMAQSFAEMFDRSAFDGEVGWAADKAMHFAGLRAHDVPGHGPNYGQVFEDHAEVYSWIYAG